MKQMSTIHKCQPRFLNLLLVDKCVKLLIQPCFVVCMCTSLTLSCFSFFFRTSSHSLTIRPQRIHESSSRWERLEEAEELDTREEPLFRLEPFMERSDLLSISSSLSRREDFHTDKNHLQQIIFSKLAETKSGCQVNKDLSKFSNDASSGISV